MRIDLYVHVIQDGPSVVAALDDIKKQLHIITTKETRLMALSDEIVAAVTEIKGTEASAIALIEALHAKVDAQLEVGDIAGARASLQEAKDSAAALAAAVAANPA